MMIDYFSKWAEAYALPNHQAKTVADCIINRWIAHHGIPIKIHSDNAPEFRGHVITQMKKMLSMKGTFTTPYKPQLNGLCERMNQMIENELAHQIDERVIDEGTDPIVSQQTTVGVSIACQTSDTDPIVISNDKVAPTIIICRSSIQRRKSHCLIYYLQI